MRAVAPRIRVPCTAEAQAHLGAPGGQQEESGAQQDGRTAQSHGCLCPHLAFAPHFVLRCGAATCPLVLRGEAVPVHPALHCCTCTLPYTGAHALHHVPLQLHPAVHYWALLRRRVSSTEGGRRCFKKGIGHQQGIEMVRPSTQWCGVGLCFVARTPSAREVMVDVLHFVHVIPSAAHGFSGYSTARTAATVMVELAAAGAWSSA